MQFKDNFLWGVATAAHQVEGNNTNSDWWAWETDPNHPVPISEPSGNACDHYNLYRKDIELLSSFGINTYRFSVEWARIEPKQGEFSDDALKHYTNMVNCCIEHGITPIVTLQHFTLPIWVEKKGGWANSESSAWFARYAKKLASTFLEKVPYVCTINEPGNMMTRSYLGLFPTPPFKEDLKLFYCAVENMNKAHTNARHEIKLQHPKLKIGMAHAIQHWCSNAGGKAAMEFSRYILEDIFLKDTAEDDFIGLQTYTRVDANLPRFANPIVQLLLKSDWLINTLLMPLFRKEAKKIQGDTGNDVERITQMGYPWAPEAIDATARRVSKLFPGKEILITEHGIGTENDEERIEYIEASLPYIHKLIEQNIPITGYCHWSLLDNFEWWDGYEPKFGLIAVDRKTQKRSPKPSAFRYGEIAKSGCL